jgi:hypothetical protein
MPILILKLNISCKEFVLGKIVKFHVSEGGDGMGQGGLYPFMYASRPKMVNLIF